MSHAEAQKVANALFHLIQALPKEVKDVLRSRLLAEQSTPKALAPTLEEGEALLFTAEDFDAISEQLYKTGVADYRSGQVLSSEKAGSV